MTTSIAFIGLGVMGFPMARHLFNSGFDTTVYNRTTSKAQQWATEFSGQYSETPREAAQNRDVVALCVGNDNDVRSVVFGADGVLAGMKAGSTLVDHTTTSAELAEELAKACLAQGVNFIDAPVSGGQAGAENGALTIMCGGEQAVFDSVLPILNSYAKQAVLVGGYGQGQRCKMVNQICIAGVLQGLSEALTLAQKSNLDIEQVVSVLKHGAAGSWQMENRATTMAEDKFDFGFAIDWMRKDLGFCLDEAKKHDLELPLTDAVDKRYGLLQNEGLGRMDTSVLIKAFNKTV
ncbi:NAD(P)-dependent oxidoreductase [Photobacterium angustum]|uniref:NAD(P)-dependent oxidoreductase n=1 Tax=Photobacterium angustum TaxID=661 RepID=A0A855SI34_PHOAN|nr:NAD(P)-dependent oxidoreductase [Photobacterium angustum]KJF80400.1 2-hydroxy-3-oxopropionate reductase [Photobacterium damselae subsp. damselae]KJG05501.1 2-hydroxy-3-oxopropionate reductase [Photobacterium angustum]KJG30106.1 2-hydroxy-3-oxopropionate reductase [Photobacterium angustum]KJG40179.1 2-hydroxy-3-oxopropionate reductase [Photobacterium angustum]KJG43853.1 2-hydroxy-3-oxopropionate reductase [Photobacterium angustum]